MTAPVEPVGFPYIHYHHGERVSPVFVEDPADYIGQHRYHVDPVLTVDPTEQTVAPLAADDNWSVDTYHSPKHYACEVK